MVHQLVRYVSVLPSCIGTVGVDNGLCRRAQHNGLANYVTIHRGVLLAGLVMPQAGEISMSKSETTRGRTFWDFCSERPVMLVLALLIVGISAVGVVLALRIDDIHGRLYIGPNAPEHVNHG